MFSGTSKTNDGLLRYSAKINQWGFLIRISVDIWTPAHVQISFNILVRLIDGAEVSIFPYESDNCLQPRNTVIRRLRFSLSCGTQQFEVEFKLRSYPRLYVVRYLWE